MTVFPRFPGALALAIALASSGANATQLLVPPGANLSLNGGGAAFQCGTLNVQGTMALGSAVHGIAGDVTIAAGGLLLGESAVLNVGGNWTNAGTFTAGSGTVNFADGCSVPTATLSGVTTFNNMSFTSATGRSFVVPIGASVNIAGALTVAGVGTPISILSADPSQPAFVTVLPTGTLSRNNTNLGTNAYLYPPNPARLANISTRMQVLTGENVMIGGFVVGGLQPKQVVIRARGPSLLAAGIAGPLPNPVLQVFSGPTVIAANDDWGTAANAAAIAASGFAPSNASESAVLMTLNPGAYTAIVSGFAGSTGVGIVEVFELDQIHAPLINIATRGQVLTGDNVMIAGFIVQGDSPQTVIVRARGPSLAAAGIAGPLANPFLQVFAGASLIGANDDWGAGLDAGVIQAAGLAPSNALESALRLTLTPGAYTVIVSGNGGGTGVGLVEVFAQ